MIAFGIPLTTFADIPWTIMHDYSYDDHGGQECVYTHRP